MRIHYRAAPDGARTRALCGRMPSCGSPDLNRTEIEADVSCTICVRELRHRRRTNPYPDSGPIRGLLGRLRAGDVSHEGRTLVKDLPRRTPGTCRWCAQSTEGYRASWHNRCVRFYELMSGSTSRWSPGAWVCDECGTTRALLEIDHRVALSVARERQLAGDPRWWLAWLPGNLRVLCHACHTAKTTSDRQSLKRLRAARAGQGDAFETTVTTLPAESARIGRTVATVRD